MADPFIVMCAPNGARKSRDDHAALPISSDELATCAEDVLAAGASLLHVHVRDDRGGHTLDAGRYREATNAIRKRVGEALVVQVTTEACGIYSSDEQMAMVRELRPEAVSLALKELCPNASAEKTAAEFFRWVNRERIMPQYILYSPDEVRRFESLRTRGIVPDEPPFVLFVLGRYSDETNAAALDDYIAAAAEDTVWAVCAFGEAEHDAASKAAASGGHARVGFENNLLLADGSVADDNAALVRAAVTAGRAASRVPATADRLREMFL